MKKIIIICLAFICQNIFAQAPNRHIELKRKRLDTQVPQVLPDTADKALRVASYVFNSKEFQDSLAKLDFKYSNHCLNCARGVRNRRERISSEEVMKDLYGKPVSNLILNLETVGTPPKDGKCYGLGATCPGTDSVTSYYANIDCDMGSDIPFSFAYGVHICHEFMHNVGYCHTNHVDDVAEEVGWIAYYYVNKWYHEGNKDFLAAVK